MAWRTISFNNHGGSGTAPSPVYQNTVGPFFASAQSTDSQYRIFNGFTGQLLSAVPAKSGNVFMGFYTSESGGTKYISSSGYWQYAAVLSSDITLHAQWRDYYIITLDANEGTPGTSKVYYKIDGGGMYLDTSLTQEATAITPPSGGGRFLGYYFSGHQMFDASGAATEYADCVAISGDATFTAQWNPFGRVVDYFGLASASLVPFESDDGRNRAHIVTRHYGKFKGGTGTTAFEGASATSGVWLNPIVKYMVVGDMTLAVTLGKAFAATSAATGYMITSVTVKTGNRRFPVVTVQGVANEGVDAVNTFPLSVAIAARARPQNLLGMYTDSETLQSHTIQLVCDPVVLAENMQPCASDVVGGRIESHAEFLSGDAEPGLSQGAIVAGAVLVSSRPVGEGTNYARYIVAARKEIV